MQKLELLATVPRMLYYIYIHHHGVSITSIISIIIIYYLIIINSCSTAPEQPKTLEFNTITLKQGSKLSIYFVHTQGAEGLKIMHPANFPWVHAYT